MSERYYLVWVSQYGYRCHAAFSAPTLADAARTQLEARRAARSPSALVLRDSRGRRYSLRDSEDLLARATA